MAVGKAGLKKEEIRYLFSEIFRTEYCHFVWTHGLPGAALWPVWCVQYLRRGAFPWSNVCCRRICRLRCGDDIEPFASAEKQFRFPLEYANQRPMSATWTVTGSGAYVLGKRKSNACITGITTGKIIDYGIKDSMNMGAAMAPAAADTICQNLKDFGRRPEDYDHIITGDLGSVGREILIDLLKKRRIRYQ